MLRIATEEVQGAAHLYSVDGALKDHFSLIMGFIQSHKIRNLSATTIRKEENFIRTWFDEHGLSHRPLYVWEAMDALKGRKLIVDYGKVLLESGITTHTIRRYLGILRRFFSYVIEHPLVFTSPSEAIRVQDRYGVTLVQPVSEFDMPTFVYDGERAGIPMDPALLYEFYAVLRKHYLPDKGHRPTRERNYAMAVLAGESGLRVDELINLEIGDLFFDCKKIQTRHGKATNGSGKRCRITLFPPLARDTIKFYISRSRKKLVASSSDLRLFPTKTGKKLAYATAQSALQDMINVATSNKFLVNENMSWHWFRRIFATRFIENCPGKMPVLIELLGHMSPNTVHRYVRHSGAWLDKQVQDTIESSEKWQFSGDSNPW